MPSKNPTPKKPDSNAGLGYPHIEKLLEHEDFENINKSFFSAYEQLEKISLDRTGGLKKQKAAQKAMKAYENTTQLINELLKIKYQIVKMRKEQNQASQKNDKKGNSEGSRGR